MSRETFFAEWDKAVARARQSNPKKAEDPGAMLKGLSQRLEREFREVEDAILSFDEAERRREAIYRQSDEELKAKYPQIGAGPR